MYDTQKKKKKAGMYPAHGQLCFSNGAGGRTRTGTSVNPTDFKFNSGVSRRYSTKLTTTLKVVDFTGLKPVLCSVFRPISPYFVLGLGSQKVVNHTSRSPVFTIEIYRDRNDLTPPTDQRIRRNLV